MNKMQQAANMMYEQISSQCAGKGNLYNIVEEIPVPMTETKYAGANCFTMFPTINRWYHDSSFGFVPRNWSCKRSKSFDVDPTEDINES